MAEVNYSADGKEITVTMIGDEELEGRLMIGGSKGYRAIDPPRIILDAGMAEGILSPPSVGWNATSPGSIS